jgi:ribosomal protein S12 methylthiotransferase
MKSSKTFHLVSLGCAKNTVDSDSMAQLLQNAGFTVSPQPEGAGVIIVNTCGFIGPAKEESLRVLSELSTAKRKGQLLIAAGCLTQRYGAEVARQVPGIDGILGTRRWMDIVQVVSGLRGDRPPVPLYHLPGDPTVGRDEGGVLRASLQGASAYLKIADGCRRPCAFCAIPLIKGAAVSRPLETLLDEARRLQDLGIQEVVLIAQDTTDYGHDLGMKDGLASLLESLVQAAPEIPWWRVMYAFPGYVTDRLIEVMAGHPQILPYLDMPLQHAHPATLKRMRRPANLDWVHRTLDKMRGAMPELALRSTFIVGYPGETDAEFEALLDFVREIRFDRLGAFQFSFEPGTASEPLGDPVPAEVKQERWERLMELQQGISLEKNQAFVGRTLQVLVEGQGDLQDADADQQNVGTVHELPLQEGKPPAGTISIGRSYRDAPEIDGLVIVEGVQPLGDLPLGALLPVRVTGAMPYDLSAVPLPNLISPSLIRSPLAAAHPTQERR